MSATTTPALDALAAGARRYLAEHWDEAIADGAASSHDRRTRLAEAAALSARRTEDVGRVVDAWAEIRRLADGTDPTGLVAAGLVAGLTAQGREATDVAALPAMVGHFLVVHPGGLIDDAADLVLGAVDLDGQVW